MWLPKYYLCEKISIKLSEEFQNFIDRGISLDKIVLFGSLARGTERQDSDIDIIIVSKDFRKKSIFERVELIAGIGMELVINAAKKEGQLSRITG